MTLPTPTILTKFIDLTATGNVVPAEPGKKIYVVKFALVTPTPTVATWYSAATQISGPIPLGTYGTFAPPGDAWNPCFTNTGTNEALDLHLSVSVPGHLGSYVNYILV